VENILTPLLKRRKLNLVLELMTLRLGNYHLPILWENLVDRISPKREKMCQDLELISQGFIPLKMLQCLEVVADCLNQMINKLLHLDLMKYLACYMKAHSIL
jgi:hypothetical protein